MTGLPTKQGESVCRSLDREKTQLQETGEVIIWPGTSLSDVMEIVLDLGIDPAEVTVSATTLRVKP